jgi:hypothetical protein
MKQSVRLVMLVCISLLLGFSWGLFCCGFFGIVGDGEVRLA